MFLCWPDWLVLIGVSEPSSLNFFSSEPMASCFFFFLLLLFESDSLVLQADYEHLL